MQKMTYTCCKCGCKKFTHHTFYGARGSMAALFDIPNGEFITVSCANCGYTEFYLKKTESGKNILDFLSEN